MRRTERLQGLRLMKFEDVSGRAYRGELSQVEAAEILGMSERSFRRYRDRFEAGGVGRSLRPPPGPGLVAARGRRRGDGDADAVRHPLLGFHGQALLGEAGLGA